MHILLALLSALGVLLFILYRISQAANAARDIADATGDARSPLRRWSWRRRFGANPLDGLQDPREAAAAMLAAVASADGGMSEKEMLAIKDEMTRHFEATQEQAEELLAHGRFLVRDRNDLSEIFRRLAPLLRAKCTPDERADLIEMLGNVATAEGPAADTVVADITRLARLLKE